MVTSTFKNQATEIKPSLPAGITLADLTEEQVKGLIDMSITAGNQLFNEQLSHAQVEVFRTESPELIEAFKDTAYLLLTGLNVPAHGGGFGNRDSVGAGVLSMLRNGDTAPFDRLHEFQKFSEGYTPELKATIKALQAYLKVHCVEKGIKVHSTHNLVRTDGSNPRFQKG